MDLGLKDRRALVTAASRGLGRATALALAGEGASVAVSSRSPDRLETLVAELRAAGAPNAVAVPGDLGDHASVAGAVEAAADALGGLDIVVGNTGGPKAGAFMDIGLDDWKAAADRTLFAMVALGRAAVPHLRRAGGGRIVFITTVGTKVVQPNMVLSDSLRLAITGVAKSMSHELAAEGIRVNCLCPGPIATGRMEDLFRATMEQRGCDRAEAERVWLDEVPMGVCGSPDDFGALVAVLASDRASFLTGASIAVDGGKSRAY